MSRVELLRSVLRVLRRVVNVTRTRVSESFPVIPRTFDKNVLQSPNFAKKCALSIHAFHLIGRSQVLRPIPISRWGVPNPDDPVQDYIAPEVIVGKSRPAEADMWALGVVAYILMSGKRPFDDIDTHRIKQRISSEFSNSWAGFRV